MIQRLDHIAITVSDLQTTADWYQRVLGLAVIHRWDPHPWMVGTGETYLALFPRDPDRLLAPHAGDLRHIAWAVAPEDFAAIQRQLHDAGVPFEGPVDHELSLSVYFSDPDGYKLEITTYPPERADRLARSGNTTT